MKVQVTIKRESGRGSPIEWPRQYVNKQTRTRVNPITGAETAVIRIRPGGRAAAAKHGVLR